MCVSECVHTWRYTFLNIPFFFVVLIAAVQNLSKIMSMKRPLVLDPHINTMSGIPRITSATCNKVTTSVAESSTRLI